MIVTRTELILIVEHILKEQEEEVPKEEESDEVPEESSEEEATPEKPKPVIERDEKFEITTLLGKIKVKIQVAFEPFSVKVYDPVGNELGIKPIELSGLLFGAIKNITPEDKNYNNMIATMQELIPDIKDKTAEDAMKWLEGRSRHFLIGLRKFKEKFSKE